MHSRSQSPRKPRSLTRAFAFNGGFFTQKTTRRILHLAGYQIKAGWPSPKDKVVIWGNSPTAHRGKQVAAKQGCSLLTVEDAFLRSLFPAKVQGEAAMGLLIDHSGVHFDPSTPSDLEQLLANNPLDDGAILQRAKLAIERITKSHLSKYTATDLDLPCPEAGYVLVIDQARDDASVTASNGNPALFAEMLYYAQEEYPNTRIVIKTHPETNSGLRQGYYGPEHCTTDHISLLSDPVSPFALLEGAIAVYTVSSQFGFEAIMMSHKPRVFGQPFYAGWGLSDDQFPVQRRQRKLTKAQLFAAAMILYPTWYDPYHDRLCALEDVIAALEARTRAWREDRHGWSGGHIRLWKRKYFQDIFGRYKKMVFQDAPQPDRPHMIWAGKSQPEDQHTRVEDGFIRSKGLGATLVPPLSLVCDDLGIYYDPTKLSRLEQIILSAPLLRPDQQRRAERIRERLCATSLSKYNLGGVDYELPEGHKILVPGQVEDDASIRTGTSHVRTNLDLLKAVRAANPEAVIIYKPHPDVETGLRIGAVVSDKALAYADLIADTGDVIALINQVDEVHTMTSLMGFEALVRGKEVTTYGAPFYAGWGLTTDLGKIPARRHARIDLDRLIHATLIEYPRYFDPKTKQACPIEVVLDRIEASDIPATHWGTRILAKAQGIMASARPFWR